MHQRHLGHAWLAWGGTLLVHGGLFVAVCLLPAEVRRPAARPPIEIIDGKLPEPPPPPVKPQPEPEPPAEAPRVAMPRKLPARLRPTPEPVRPAPEPPSEKPPPEDTGPKIFGDRLEGVVTAPPGQGVPIPSGDSLQVSPRVTRKGKAPEQKPSGFKKEYGAGEEAPLAVITAQARVLRQVTVEYPERMKELGVEGKVTLELTVGATGKVLQVHLVKSLHPELDRVAMNAARQLLFSPAMVGKTPVKVKIPYTFTFVLD